MAAANCCPALDAGSVPAPQLPLILRFFFRRARVHCRAPADLYHQAAHSKLRVCSRVRCDRAGLISICEPVCGRSRRVSFCELARCCLGHRCPPAGHGTTISQRWRRDRSQASVQGPSLRPKAYPSRPRAALRSRLDPRAESQSNQHQRAAGQQPTQHHIAFQVLHFVGELRDLRR